MSSAYRLWESLLIVREAFVISMSEMINRFMNEELSYSSLELKELWLSTDDWEEIPPEGLITIPAPDIEGLSISEQHLRVLAYFGKDAT